MADIEFSYKGTDVAIDFTDEEREHADIKIRDRTFPAALHEGPLRAWACNGAYFMSPEIRVLAKHLIDYWYIVSDPSSGPLSSPDDAHGGGSSHGSESGSSTKEKSADHKH